MTNLLEIRLSPNKDFFYLCSLLEEKGLKGPVAEAAVLWSIILYDIITSLRLR